MPGVSGAEGKEKGKGLVARRGLKEVQSESAWRIESARGELKVSGTFYGLSISRCHDHGS